MTGLHRLRAVPQEIAAQLDEGFRTWQLGQEEVARAQLSAALRQSESAKSAEGVIGARHLLGLLAFTRGDLAEAWQQLTYVLERSRALGIEIGVASALHNLGLLAAREGDGQAAGDLLRAAIAHYTVMGRPDSAAAVRENLRRIMG